MSEASQGNRGGGAKSRAVVRGIGKSDRGAVVGASRGQASQSRRVEASQRRRRGVSRERCSMSRVKSSLRLST